MTKEKLDFIEVYRKLSLLNSTEGEEKANNDFSRPV